MVLEIYIGKRFLEHCFYCYSQQITSAVAKEFLIPYNLIEREPQLDTPTKQFKNFQICKKNTT